MENKFANRGKGLERAVKKLFAVYETRGIHCQQNHPEQLHDGTLVERHGFDFQIFYNRSFIAFDAKECALPRWPLDKAKVHQLKALLTVKQNGGEAFFLVWFKKLRMLVRFDVETIRKALEDKRASVSPEEGIVTSINILGV